MRAVPAACLDLIHQFEGKDGTFEATRQQDPVGNWEIGWSHKLSGPSDPLWDATLAKGDADDLAMQDLSTTASATWVALGDAAVQNLTDNQWAAVLDFVYNEGVGHFKASALCHLISTGDLANAVNEFPKWIYAGSPPRALAGLIRRRNAEVALWNTP